jgi:hypothetical protein
MGRRSERLSKQGMLAGDLAGEGDVIDAELFNNRLERTALPVSAQNTKIIGGCE